MAVKSIIPPENFAGNSWLTCQYRLQQLE
uniref:Uncharacterized protein n=1 Tax=Arundo donax TaxID=35708 RepID=A0A0A8ZNT3_ARUDO